MKKTNDQRQKNKLIVSLMSVLIFYAAPGVRAQIAGGGQFTLNQSVIAAGGATNSAGGNYALGGTLGQSVAGQNASGQASSVYAGFWHPAPLAPTAANVTVGGRVTTSDGRGIRNVYIKMTDAGGNARVTFSGSFGYFRFDDVTVGGTYVFSVTAKSYQFAEPVLVRSIVDSADDLNFVALDNN